MSGATSFLVLGAGELGMPMLRSLAQRAKQKDATVTILLRPASINSTDSAKLQVIHEIRELGVSVLPGDIARGTEDELCELFRPFDTVIGCTGFAYASGTQIKLAQAVLKAGVKRYFSWQFGVAYDVIGKGSGQDLWDEQLDVRDILRGQNQTEWVIVSTGMFTSFLFEPSFGIVDLAAGTVRALGDWENAVTVTTPEDIGAITTEIIFAEPRVANQIVFTGSDTVTYSRLAEIVESVSGRKMQRERWPCPLLTDELSQDPQDTVKKYRVAFAKGTGISWTLENTFNYQKGLPVTDVQLWAQLNIRR